MTAIEYNALYIGNICVCVCGGGGVWVCNELVNNS